MWLAVLAAVITSGPAVTNGVSAPETSDNSMIFRVGGAQIGEVQQRGDTYVVGRCFTGSPLPAGYPRPTPPGAMEIKRYPSVRRAYVEGGGDARRSSSRGFWPLFRHISDRDIAMTAPVEMDYEMEGDAEWRMAFLYRTEDLGPTGNAEDGVVVDDSPEVTVLSLGIMGGRSGRTIAEAEAALDAWLASRDDWQATGDKRWMGYNGPSQRRDLQWWELQFVIEPSPGRGE
ncbi:MAG: heme-binding protein [Planctomycetota bacterium]